MTRNDSHSLAFGKSTMRQPKLLLLILAAGLASAGCEQAVVGESAMLKTSLPQSLIGPFSETTFATASGDLDGDGLADIVIYDHLGSASEGSIGPDGRVDLRYTSPPARVRVYYGREAGFGEVLREADADATLILRRGEYVQDLVVRDIDEDGDGDLTVIAPMSNEFDPNAGTLYIARGGSRLTDEVSLESVSDVTPMALRTTIDWRRAAPLDLDGTPGLELVMHRAEPVASVEPGSGAIAPEQRGVEIHHVEDGSLVASLEPRAAEQLTLLGVLDLDADGSPDIVTTYQLASADGSSWREQGVGVFYGPFTGTRQLGDEGTATLPGDGWLYSGVVGNFAGDAHEDLLMIGSGGLLALTGGARLTDGALEAALTPVATGGVDPRGDFGPWIGMREDRDGDGFDEILAAQGQVLRIFTPRGEVLAELELAYDDGSAIGTFYGGDLGDVNGDGLLDLVLGTASAEAQPTVVHIVYGFGG